MNRKLQLMVGAALAASSFAAAAQAAVTIDYGGGSSLIAPYLRQAADCYGVPVPPVTTGGTLWVKGGNPVNEPFFNFVGTPAQNCATTHTSAVRELSYISTGSGAGIAGVYSNDPVKYFGDIDPTTAGNQFYPSIQYGASDAGLAASDVTIYNSGGTEGSGANAVTVVAPGGTPTAGQYSNPHEKYGALVQFPLLVTPVDFAYDPVYKKVKASGTVTEYKLNVQAARADGSGGLKLDKTAYCKIFNGQITNWNDPALTTLNGGVSLKDPADPGAFSVPLQIVGRGDSSGTTSIFTRHLGAVCTSVAGNQFTDGATTLPAGTQGGTYDKTTANFPAPAGEVLGKFTLTTGSDGVAKYVDFTAVPVNNGDTIIQGRLGYLGPDFALPASAALGTNAFGLNTATLKNAKNVFQAPTTKTVTASFGSVLPPQSDSKGNYVAANPGNRADPSQWAASVHSTETLANPQVSGGYPVIGTTNFIGSQCESTSAKSGVLTGLFTWYLTNKTIIDPTNGLLGKAGFAPMPAAWKTAIKGTFLANTSGLGLNMSNKGNAASAACSVAGVVGR